MGGWLQVAPTIPAKSHWLGVAAGDCLIGEKQRLKLDRPEME